MSRPKKVSKYVFHKASPMLRNKILNDGIIAYKGGQWLSDTPIKGTAVFATNSDKEYDWFDTTYDDDVWVIDTSKVPQAKWHMDPNFTRQGSDTLHIYTKTSIPKDAIKLFKKGTGKDMLERHKIIKKLLREGLNYK